MLASLIVARMERIEIRDRPRRGHGPGLRSASSEVLALSVFNSLQCQPSQMCTLKTNAVFGVCKTLRAPTSTPIQCGDEQCGGWPRARLPVPFTSHFKYGARGVELHPRDRSPTRAVARFLRIAHRRDVERAADL